jgi:hypothetical protein
VAARPSHASEVARGNELTQEQPDGDCADGSATGRVHAIALPRDSLSPSPILCSFYRKGV